MKCVGERKLQPVEEREEESLGRDAFLSGSQFVTALSHAVAVSCGRVKHLP